MRNRLRRTGIRASFAIQAKTGNPEGSSLVVFHQVKVRIDLADPHPRAEFWRDHLAVAGRFSEARGNSIGSIDPHIIHGGNRLIAELPQKDGELPGDLDRIGICIAGGCIDHPGRRALRPKDPMIRHVGPRWFQPRR